MHNCPSYTNYVTISTCTVNGTVLLHVWYCLHLSLLVVLVVLYLFWLVWVSACLWQYFSYVLTVTMYRKLKELGVHEDVCTLDAGTF